jgi:hypothetical protein
VAARAERADEQAAPSRQGGQAQQQVAHEDPGPCVVVAVSVQVLASAKSAVRSLAVVASGVTVAPVEVVTAAVVPEPLPQAARRLPSPSELMP